ncbi:MAG: hypothetical protein EOO89_00245 [Pedobacter sp.]|nr:MAG: hypothetical protein EOO89_00245 [Pedobacter sp.]
MHENNFIPLIIFGTLVFVMLVFILTTFLIIHKQRQKRNLLEKRETAYKYQNQLLRTRLEVEQLALKSVSREIHDNVNQILGIVRMNLFYAMRTETRGESNAVIAEANDMAKEAIDHLRNLSHTLSGSVIKKMGLVNAVRKELHNISALSSINVSLLCEEEELPVSAEEEILIFRIIQESLSNIIKHADATQIVITISLVFNELSIAISDNGTGMMETTESTSEGLGMLNMYERAALLNGHLHFESVPGKGMNVNLKIKVRDDGKNKPYNYDHTGED